MDTPKTKYGSNEERELTQLFLGLWAHKILIFIATTIFTIGATYYALTIEKVYTARSIFTLDLAINENDILSGISRNLGGVNSLFGLPTSSRNSSAAFIERVSSKEFILEIAPGLGLYQDQFFNPEIPIVDEPVWKARLKKYLKIKSRNSDLQNLEDWQVVNNYQENVKIETTSAGNFSILVRHTTPERASEISNALVENIILLHSNESRDEIEARMRYLSTTLADASEQLEEAQDALKNYSMDNSTQAIESFAAGSVILDELRRQRDMSSEQLQTTVALKESIDSGETTLEEYKRLSRVHRPLDQASFRRMLGLSEIISAWTWPTLEAVSQVEASIRDRIGALEGEIEKLESEARRYAVSAEKFARLSRDLKLAEATYTVLLEQIKSQSLASGFKLNKSKILESADTPIFASEPQRNTIIAIGILLGLTFGCASALVLILRKGTIYGSGALFAALGAEHIHTIKNIRQFKAKELDSVGKLLLKSPLLWARQVVLECERSKLDKPFIIADLSRTNCSVAIAKIVAATAGELERSVAIINLSRYSKISDRNLELHCDGRLGLLSSSEKAYEYVYMGSHQNLGILYSRSLNNILKELSNKHELVFFSAEESVLDDVMSWCEFGSHGFVVAVRSGKTQLAMIKRICDKGSIQVALHV